MKSLRVRGFSAVEVLLVIVIVAVIGFIGYTVAQNTIFKKDAAIDNINMSEKATDVPAAPEINTDSDLLEVTETLDSIDLNSDSGDIEAIESQLSEF